MLNQQHAITLLDMLKDKYISDLNLEALDAIVELRKMADNPMTNIYVVISLSTPSN
jgi:hypothetical protein